MKTIITKLNKWANARTNLAIDVLRIGVGAFFFIKGLQFLDQTKLIVELIHPINPSAATLFVAHYVALVHLSGGLLITFGLLTRLSCLLQLPIVIGAVLVNFTSLMNINNLAEASLALLFCLFFLIYGSGKHSVDYSLKLQV